AVQERLISAAGGGAGDVLHLVVLLPLFKLGDLLPGGFSLIEPAEHVGELELGLLRIRLEFPGRFKLNAGLLGAVQFGENKAVVVAGRVFPWIGLDGELKVRRGETVLTHTAVSEASEIVSFGIAGLMSQDF